jgi:hypothetical protein
MRGFSQCWLPWDGCIETTDTMAGVYCMQTRTAAVETQQAATGHRQPTAEFQQTPAPSKAQACVPHIHDLAFSSRGVPVYRGFFFSFAIPVCGSCFVCWLAIKQRNLDRRTRETAAAPTPQVLFCHHATPLIYGIRFFIIIG